MATDNVLQNMAMYYYNMYPYILSKYIPQIYPEETPTHVRTVYCQNPGKCS